MAYNPSSLPSLPSPFFLSHSGVQLRAMSSTVSTAPSVDTFARTQPAHRGLLGFPFHLGISPLCAGKPSGLSPVSHPSITLIHSQVPYHHCPFLRRTVPAVRCSPCFTFRHASVPHYKYIVFAAWPTLRASSKHGDHHCENKQGHRSSVSSLSFTSSRICHRNVCGLPLDGVQ